MAATITPAQKAELLADWLNELGRVNGSPDPARLAAIEAQAAEAGVPLIASAERLFHAGRTMPPFVPRD